MAKDSYWFRHDSTAGRGLRMRKMAHIYGHWGKGVYWDVIEVLRDQTNYCFDSDDSSLQMLADLIGCKDEQKFLSWVKDCLKITLLEEKDGKLFSAILCENMSFWEKQKENGAKSSGNTNPKHSQRIAKGIGKAKPKDNITVQDSIDNTEQKRDKKIFVPPTLEMVIEYFKESGYTEQSARKAHEHYRLADWHDTNGHPVKAWKQKMHTVWFKDENKAKVTPQKVERDDSW